MILDDENILMNNCNNDVNRTVFDKYKVPMASFREEHSIEEYATHLEAYRKISLSYVDFFKRYWFKDDVNETNRLMREQLSNSGWSGLTEEENNPLGEYVLHLDFPASWSDMQELFQRVESGDLEFRCRYPIGDTNALDIIRNLKNNK